eukprot:353569-Chlamydomonas_euryale.AAC.2
MRPRRPAGSVESVGVGGSVKPGLLDGRTGTVFQETGLCLDGHTHASWPVVCEPAGLPKLLTGPHFLPTVRQSWVTARHAVQSSGGPREPQISTKRPIDQHMKQHMCLHS